MIRIATAIVATLVLAGYAEEPASQEVPIPDPGLNAAIRDALRKPNGSLLGAQLDQSHDVGHVEPRG
jgi:hypothetical protein